MWVDLTAKAVGIGMLASLPPAGIGVDRNAHRNMLGETDHAGCLN
jgi:hypothetical protein